MRPSTDHRFDQAACHEFHRLDELAAGAMSRAHDFLLALDQAGTVESNLALSGADDHGASTLAEALDRGLEAGAVADVVDRSIDAAAVGQALRFGYNVRCR